MNENNAIEQIYPLCEQDYNFENEKEIKELLSPYKDGSIGIAQLNPIVGNLEYNAKKIIKYIKHAQSVGLDFVVFPELALVGYPFGNLLDRYPNFADENIKWLNQIAKMTRETAAFVGFVGFDTENKDKICSTIAILQNGVIQKIIKKSDKNASVVINNKKYLIVSGDNGLENIDGNCDVIINCCASITSENYNQFQILSLLSKKYSTPIVRVNQVGAIDNFSFDGASVVFDKNGEVQAFAKTFEEQFLIVNPDNNLGKIYQSTEMYNQCHQKDEAFSLDYEKDLERTYKTVIQGIKDYFRKTGFKRAVLGLSGGLDSTVCAVLLADALGAENVFGISMPSKITSNESKTDAQQLAQNLGMNFATLPIKDIVESANTSLQGLFSNIETKWSGRYKESYTMDNIQARSRAVILWGVSNEFGSCLPIATSDKSEAYMGYATINGDMSGGFAPIADITKTKLFALARWLNKNREVKNAIPESIILKRPGAELAIDPNTGKPLCAEDALMPYEFMDEVIWRIENKKESYNDMLHSEFLYERTHKTTKEQKIQWLDKFYKRMNSALYKASIMPPLIYVDSKPINKYGKQPITASAINYKGNSEEEIRKILNT